MTGQKSARREQSPTERQLWTQNGPVRPPRFSTKCGSGCFPRVIGQSQELKHHMRYLITTL